MYWRLFVFLNFDRSKLSFIHVGSYSTPSSIIAIEGHTGLPVGNLSDIPTNIRKRKTKLKRSREVIRNRLKRRGVDIYY